VRRDFIDGVVGLEVGPLPAAVAPLRASLAAFRRGLLLRLPLRRQCSRQTHSSSLNEMVAGGKQQFLIVVNAKARRSGGRIVGQLRSPAL